MTRTPREARGAELGRMPSNGMSALPQSHRSSPIRIAPSIRRAETLSDVRFSNRPVGVKRFQTIHDCGVDVTHGLVLLYGIGT